MATIDRAATEREIDEAIDESFPASDPPAHRMERPESAAASAEELARRRAPGGVAPDRGNRIPTRVHGVIDYLFGAMLIAMGVVQLQSSVQAGVVALVLGGATLLLGVLTRYELGVVKLIPMRIHLVVDVVLGAALALSPWVMGFYDTSWAPHFFLGVIGVCMALMSASE